MRRDAMEMGMINLLRVYETQNFSCKYFVLRKMR